MDLKDKHIITVDDDYDFSQSIKNFLEDFYVHVHNFSDGYKALDYLNSHPESDLLIVDLRMPKMDGIEILTKIKNKGSKIPVIVISATHDVQSAIEAVKAGASDFLSKPIQDLGQLEICISRTLQRAADKNELEEYRKGLENLVKQKTEELTKANEELNIQIEKTKIAEKKVRQGSQRYIDAVESAIKETSKDLHDSIGQKLTLTKINLNLLSKKFSGEDKNLVTAIKNIEEVGDEVRRMVKKLYPQSIDKYSLKKNLESLIKDYEETEKLTFNLTFIDHEKPLTKELKLDIFRVFQEAFNNIIKHADATAADVFVEKSDKLIRINIKDNGKGIDVNMFDDFSGSGLFTMQERIVKYGGSFNLKSESEKGTEIQIEIKL